MKTPDSLNQKIWKECALEVATKFKERRPFTQSECREAALLAMEKQAGFYRWASIHKWRHDDPFMDGGYWYKNSGVYRGKRLTELELYNIWREGK